MKKITPSIDQERKCMDKCQGRPPQKSGAASEKKLNEGSCSCTEQMYNYFVQQGFFNAVTTIQAIPLTLENTMLTMPNTSGSNDKYTQFNNLAGVSIQRRRITYALRVCKTAPEGINDTKNYNQFSTNQIIGSIPSQLCIYVILE